jgi:hypothetical protein
MRLYELCDEILRLQNAAYEADDAEFERLQAEFADTKLAMNVKLENIAKLIRQMDIDSQAIVNEQTRLDSRLGSLQSRVKALKFYVGNCLGEGVSLKTPLFSFTWRKSTSVEITGEVPEQYARIKTTVEPDKKQIADDLKAGAQLPFARLVEKQTLQVK